MRSYGEIVSRYPSNPLDPTAPCIIVRTHEGWDMTTVEIEEPHAVPQT